MSNLPEKLSLWDRLFNRYRTTVINEGSENWFKSLNGVKLKNSDYVRNYVKYKRVDRVTGSEEIYIKYLSP